jgi:hypothetical protein
MPVVSEPAKVVLSVGGVTEDVTLFIAARDHMVERAGELQTRWSGQLVDPRVQLSGPHLLLSRMAGFSDSALTPIQRFSVDPKKKPLPKEGLKKSARAAIRD